MRKRTIAIVWVVFALCTTFAFAHESSEPVGFELEQSFYSNYCPDIADDYKLLEKEYRELSEDAHSKSFYFNLSLDEYLVYRNSNIDIDYSIFYANDEIEIETEEIARSGGDAFYYNTGYNCPEQATYTRYNLL